MIECRYPNDQSHSMRLFRMQMKKLIPFLAVLSLALLLFGIIFILTDDLFLGVGFCVMAVLFPPLIYFASYSSQKKFIQSSPILAMQAEVYVYVDENSIVEQLIAGGTVVSHSMRSFPLISHAVEYPDLFFLYIAKTMAIALPKASIYTGSVEELRALLARQLGSKFTSKVK